MRGGKAMANGEKGKGRSQNQRLKLFYLLNYLLEETDETHTKKVQEIIEHFDNYHKIPFGCLLVRSCRMRFIGFFLIM